MDVQKMADTVLEAMKGYVSRAVSGFTETLNALDGRLKAVEEGRAVLVADIVAEIVKTDALSPMLDLYATEAVAKHFESHPVRDGKDAPPVSDDQIEAHVAKHLKANPPKDGTSVTVDDIAIYMDAALSKWALDFERRASDTLSKAIDKIPTPKDGKDGVDFSEVAIDYDGERTITIKGRGGDIVKHVPIPLDRGYWREGMACEKADVVTHAGTAFIALRDTKAKPARENGDDWRILARGGRDGQEVRTVVTKPSSVSLKGDDDA